MKIYAIYTLLGVVALSVIFAVIYPLFNADYTDFYIRLFLLLFIIQTFAILRLYNAVFNNTRLSLKLSSELKKLTENIVKENNMNRNREMQIMQLNNSLRELKKVVNENSMINSLLTEQLRNRK